MVRNMPPLEVRSSDASCLTGLFCASSLLMAGLAGKNASGSPSLGTLVSAIVPLAATESGLGPATASTLMLFCPDVLMGAGRTTDGSSVAIVAVCLALVFVSQSTLVLATATEEQLENKSAQYLLNGSKMWWSGNTALIECAAKRP